MTMTSTKTFHFGAALMLAAFLLCAPPAHSQTALNAPTLSAALAVTADTVSLSASTGITLPGPNQTNLPVLVVDREVMLINSLVSGNVYKVARGQYGTLRVGHVSGATVWVAPDKALSRGAYPAGSCTRTNLPYVPIIFVAPNGPNIGRTGDTFDCLGGQIVQTNLPVSVKGSDVLSATSITPTGTFFVVSGTTAVATIVVPAGWAPGNCLAIEPTGIFATTTAANIGLITSGTVVGRILFMCWDGSKWWPSYVS
jgi:hypothetical protein